MARIRAEPESPISWADVQNTMVLDKRGLFFAQIPGECPPLQTKGCSREEGNAHKQTLLNTPPTHTDVVQKIIHYSRRDGGMSGSYSPLHSVGVLVMDLTGSTCAKFIKYTIV